MNQSSQIDYPTLTLFLYDVREELGQDGEKVQQNRHQFWRKIEPALDKEYSDIGEGDRRLLVQLEAAEKPEASEVEVCLEKAVS